MPALYAALFTAGPPASAAITDRPGRPLWQGWHVKSAWLAFGVLFGRRDPGQTDAVGIFAVELAGNRPRCRAAGR